MWCERGLSHQYAVLAVIYIRTVVLLGCIANRPVIGWRLPHSNSTQITDDCGVGHRDTWQLLCLRYMQAMPADPVIAYITHDDRPGISSASSRPLLPFEMLLPVYPIKITDILTLGQKRRYVRWPHRWCHWWVTLSMSDGTDRQTDRHQMDVLRLLLRRENKSCDSDNAGTYICLN